MPACLKTWPVMAYSNSAFADLYLARTATGGGSLLTKASLLVPDLDTTDLSGCSAVALSGVEYKSLVARIGALENKPASSTGGSTVNVTADIFVAAALVCIFVLGWIAGAQR
jgi:hypothetical protein